MIKFDQKNSIFYLTTKNTSYIMGVLNDTVLTHLHWGGKIAHIDSIETVITDAKRGMCAASKRLDLGYCEDVIPLEYSPYGTTDLREPSLVLRYADKSAVGDFRYAGYEIVEGKPALCGLPSTYCEAGDSVSTLIIKLEDKLNGINLYLSYSVFDEYDAITRSVRLENVSDAPVEIDRIFSANIDMRCLDFEIITLEGAWCRDRFVHKNSLLNGNVSISSMRGVSGHNRNPFFALADKNTTETQGEAYGVSFVYSGNFEGGVQKDAFNSNRVYIGINSTDFSEVLNAGESFTAPEVVLAYSDEGLSGMSRIYHKLYRERLCRGIFRDKERDVLINNWEGTYFNFDDEKIVNIAKVAKEMNLDLLVLDDGWFGVRDHDRCSLGDWVVNLNKLKGGLDGLAKSINDLGLRFGLWFEPEMISEDSDLFRAHPDWRMPSGKVTPSPSRWQYILDLSRKEVQDYVIESVCAVLASANIEYVKWDFNRNMAEIPYGGTYKYIVGLYRVMEEITSRNPNVLFESCASGGGRFDPGMLHYMPQVWTSDCSDALERLSIQYGTSMCYPYSTMGAHISAVPNHQTRRTTPFGFRADVAMVGQFGFELDTTKMTEEELQLSRDAVAKYKKLREIFHTGDLYRLKSPFEGNTVALEFLSQDKNKCVVCYYVERCHCNDACELIKLHGLDANGVYRVEDTDKVYGGDFLMKYGLDFDPNMDYKSEIVVLIKE